MVRARWGLLSMTAAATVLAPTASVAAAGAAAPAAGTLRAVRGHVFVARDGRLLRARSSMRLAGGDRVLTQADGSARVVLRQECGIALGASASAVVGTCADTRVVDFAGPGAGAGSGGAAAGRAGFANGGTVAVALAGAAAVVLGIAAAAQGGQPNSP